MRARSYRILLLAVLGLIFFAWHLNITRTYGTGADYHHSFRPAVVNWIDGTQQLYDPPYWRSYNPPWIYLTMVPMAWLGYYGFNSALALLTAAVMILAWKTFARRTVGVVRPLSLAVCVFNLHVFDLFFRSQVDAYMLLGITLLYVGILRKHPDLIGAGWAFAVTRPTGDFLLLFYSAWIVYRQGIFLRSLVIPTIAFVASTIVFNPGWIGRYLVMMRDIPPLEVPWSTTFWRAAHYFNISDAYAIFAAVIITVVTGWIIVRWRPNLHASFALLIAASLLVANYTLSYHYLILIFVAVPLLLSRRPRLALPMYLLTLTPLLRLRFGIDISWVDIVFPIAIWLLLIYHMAQQTRTGVLPIAQPKPI